MTKLKILVGGGAGSVIISPPERHNRSGYGSSVTGALNHNVSVETDQAYQSTLRYQRVAYRHEARTVLRAYPAVEPGVTWHMGIIAAESDAEAAFGIATAADSESAATDSLLVAQGEDPPTAHSEEYMIPALMGNQVDWVMPHTRMINGDSGPASPARASLAASEDIQPHLLIDLDHVQMWLKQASAGHMGVAVLGMRHMSTPADRDSVEMVLGMVGSPCSGP